MSVCLLAGPASPGKQPIRDLCQATVATQLQQLWHSSDWWEQDNNSNDICGAVIPHNRSRRAEATVGGPVLWRRHGNKLSVIQWTNALQTAFVQKQTSPRNVLPHGLKPRTLSLYISHRLIWGDRSVFGLDDSNWTCRKNVFLNSFEL